MGIVTVTARPRKYALLEGMEENPSIEAVPSMAKMRLTFQVEMRRGLDSAKQKKLAELIGGALNLKPKYVRNRGEGAVYDRGYYKVGDWRVSCGNHVSSPLFELHDARRILCVTDALEKAGYCPEDGVTVRFSSEELGLQQILNLYNIVLARSELITRALALPEEIRVVVDFDNVAFSVMLDAFSLERVEACIYLLHQACGQAVQVSKARMKPCDGSNPKFQMRSWLLRLGFIGEEFERPRQTLMRGLEGNGAYFNEEGKQKAYEKRIQAKVNDWKKQVAAAQGVGR